MGDVTPPPLRGPSSKERKYDRQLRLWAASGQAALEQSHILLLNSGPGVVGIETLKNLVLPGVGQFTILDPAQVTEVDLGVNFFLEDEDLGKSRAECCSHWLQELNPDVKGHHDTNTFEAFFAKQDALLPYTLILVTLPVAHRTLTNISNTAHDLGIPNFYIHSVGFYSYFTLHLPHAFPIVDTHPDPSTITDLRILEPWPELDDYAEEKTAKMDEMDDEQHGHVPYVLLLLRTMREWKSSHAGQPPQNYMEKIEFKSLVRQGMRSGNAEGGEENFDEAAAAVLRSLNPALPSSAVKDVFAAEECKDLRRNSAAFWIIAHAIRDFFEEHGVLPVSGGIPDMKAKSADYVQLQNIYKSKARQDVADVLRRVRSLEQSLGKPEAVPSAEVEAFCKSSGYVKLVRGRPAHLSQLVSSMKWNDRATSAASSLQIEDSLISIYITLLAYDAVSSTDDESNDIALKQLDVDELVGAATTIIDNLIEEAGTVLEDDKYSTVKDKVFQVASELVRAEGSELHNISAVTGGMVAQEAIKVITKQYIPVDNTCIFDGIRSKTSVLRL